MDRISLSQFRDNLQRFIDQVVEQHVPLKVEGHSGSDVVVISAEDWAQTQETLYVLQNTNLMQQIARSAATHTAGQGYHPSPEEIDAILGV
jgi:antitoxin YefM